MKRVKKKYLIAACSLFAALLIAVVMAFFSDTDMVTNSFAVGDVDLRLVEPKYPDDPKDRVLAYGQRMPKDPKVVNNGRNDELVFLKVVVPLENVTLLDEQGQKITGVYDKPCEVFNFSSDSAEKKVLTSDNYTKFEIGKDWVLLGGEKRNSVKTYLFGYNKKLQQGDTTTSLFDKVYLKGFIEQSSLSVSPESIDVTAYGIQADYVGAEPEGDGTYSEANLLKAYDAMFDYAEENVQSGGGGGV